MATYAVNTMYGLSYINAHKAKSSPGRLPFVSEMITVQMARPACPTA